MYGGGEWEDIADMKSHPAARTALKRKKQHEHSLEQTNGQVNMLEQQIYSIESANINQETLVAMKNAGAAMKQIHGKMTMEDVDNTMFVFVLVLSWEAADGMYREQLREQHELTQEIGNAITSMPITEPIDEDELEGELEAMEQENLDKELLKTGTVPVNDRVGALPAAANGPSKSLPSSPFIFLGIVLRLFGFWNEVLTNGTVKGKTPQPAEEEDEEEEEQKLQAEMAM